MLGWRSLKAGTPLWLMAMVLAFSPARAEPPLETGALPIPPAERGAPVSPPALPAEAAVVTQADEVPIEPSLADAFLSALSKLPDVASENVADEQVAKENAAIKAFYAARGNAPLWFDSGKLTDQAAAVFAEIQNADAWGLSAHAFELPSALDPSASPEARAAADVMLTRAVLKYARHARGGRIMDPAADINSHIDRKPKLVEPKTLLDDIVAAPLKDAYLRGLHTTHAQFQKLRQKYLAARPRPKWVAKLPASGPDVVPGSETVEVASLRYRLGVRGVQRGKTVAEDNRFDDLLRDAVIDFQTANGIAPADGTVNAATRAALNQDAGASAKVIAANMEQWRWMWTNMGDLYLWANVPEFEIRVVKDGATIHAERIVAGEVGKQTSIFSRPLKSIVFRPKWRVPESIKVRELWPSLQRGGGLMRQFGLQLETKDGDPLDWRKIDWANTDIRKYEVTQPPGRASVLGVVKFTFPSQHTIYMHDTPDKWMFRSAQRTLSHGCLRLRNPMRVAELVLSSDKGWDAKYLTELTKTGPLNNEVMLDHEVPMHITYFTAVVDEAGKLRTFKDVYGHERRITLALDGKWKQIDKGEDHLATVELSSAPRPRAAKAAAKKESPGDFIGAVLGGF